jgi:hypothetical protein
VGITPQVAAHILRSVLGRLKEAALAFRSVRVEKKFIEAEKQLLSLAQQPTAFAQTLQPA